MSAIRFNLLAVAVFAVGLLASAPALAGNIGVSLWSDNSVCTTNGSASACQMDSGVFGSDVGMGWNTAGGVSPPISGLGSTSTNFAINGVAAVDGGGDTTAQARLNFDILLNIVVDHPAWTWSVNLNQSVLGLFGLRGDGTASQVGNQSDGSASISGISTTVGGTPYNFSASPSSYTADVTATQQKSQQFSGSRVDAGILSGTGSQSVLVNIDFDLTAFSNDGCSGFICSSISGGEEAATLFGAQGVIDQAVDDYSTWGRSIGPDGYNSTWQLNVLTVPEPSTALLLAVGLGGLGIRRRSLRTRNG